MSSGYSAVFLLWMFAISMVLGYGSDTLDIWCLRDNVKAQTNLVKEAIGGYVQCKARETDDYPWTFNDSQDTPAPPDSIHLRVHTYKVNHSNNNRNNNRQIAIIADWTHKVQHFSHVKKYHIELNFIRPHGTDKQYLIEWNETLLNSAIENSTATFLKFHFIYAGIPGNYHIQPEHEYRFKIQSCPIYLENDSPQNVKDHIIVPGCENEIINETAPCHRRKRRCRHGYKRGRRGRCHKIPIATENDVPVGTTAATQLDATTMYLEAEKLGVDAVHIILLMFGGLLLVGLLIVFACLFMRRKSMCAKQPPTSTRRRVLLICTTNERYSAVVNQTIKTLKKFPNVDVTCNLREKTKIGAVSIKEWTSRNVTEADAVGFMISKPFELANHSTEENENSILDGDNIEKHQVGIVLRASELLYLNTKKDEGRKVFVVADLKNCVKKEDVPYFKQLKLPADFKKFIKILAGSKSEVPKEDWKLFKSFLCIAQNEPDDVNYINEEDEDSENGSTKIQDKIENDLNFSCLMQETSFSPNVMDGPPSCESNQSQDYITMDGNDDVALIERFRQAGAIPKSSC